MGNKMQVNLYIDGWQDKGCIFAKIRQTNSEDIQLFLFHVENEAYFEKRKYTFGKVCHKLSISVFILFQDDVVNL